MFLQTSNLCLKIIALPPGLELRANPMKARELHGGDFEAFGMNIEHLSTWYAMRKKQKKTIRKGILTFSQFPTRLAILAPETCLHDPR
jgi:hypothetical protein